MKEKIVIRQEAIAWTNKGTYKNLEKVLNNLPKDEEFVQVENSMTHLHLITRKLDKSNQKIYKFIIRSEPISFTLQGTYSNLQKEINKLPKDEEFVQICTTMGHLHLITRKEIAAKKTPDKSTKKK
jgi:hypothetical protein